MLKRILFISVVPFTLLNNAMALPWLPKEGLNTSSTALTIAQVSPVGEALVNFSGDWTGQCDNTQAVDLSIKQDPNRIAISYGFMEEKYFIGEVQSSSSAQGPRSENSHVSVRWNPELSALIFIQSKLFSNEQGHLNSFFSKVSMTLENDKLLVNGQYYYTNANVGPIQQDTINCLYIRK
ncbi:hypothetical protein [Legionella waltersii]|uniref:Uncharacterized protein n=1 Tax=Legionella waltersii TaxID=66969 RepID=A0A0W1AC98_9GAMM|nr:hypothetical protein [Legionella waltersii]KTD78800.1 hypothetical protein Lwal_1570 [Legionella waltersii]SNV11077.1 Uncharacterised protein [Legionella waltersii]